MTKPSKVLGYDDHIRKRVRGEKVPLMLSHREPSPTTN
jgi:hypothetical protein